MRKTIGLLVFLLAVVVFATTAACGDGNSSSGTSGAGAGNAGGGDGGDLFGTGGGLSASLTLDPPEATIVVTNGASSPVQFSAMKDGQVVFPSSWSVNYGTIADTDASGLVTAAGTKGGEVTLTAELDGVIGTAKIYVQIHKTVNPEGIPDATLDLLRNASGQDAAITWAYPYNGTVWPRGLKGPEMMWNGSGAGDVYRQHFVGAYIDIEVFGHFDPPSRYQIDTPEWTAISESGGAGSGDVAVTVARLPNGASNASIVIDHDWKMSRGSLRGTVYYWANNLGRVVRIKPGQDVPDDFLAAAGITQCTACHTVSADGRTLAIGGDDPTSIYDLLNDTVTLQLGTVGKAVRNWAMPALSPDGRFLVENNAPLPGPPGGADGTWDVATGMKIPGLGLDGVLCDMPAFGPKGHKLAYVDHGGSHDLRVFDFDLPSGVSSNGQLLVPAGSDPNLSGICFPNVSPTITDGEGPGKTYITYHRGTYPGSLDTRTGPGDLYMASADEPGIEWRLAKSNGDSYPFAAGARDLSYNYEPTFAPQAAGGYMWVVFTSRRTYGNRLTGAKDAVKQLWVAAIDPFPQPGTDPSYPAFWVPGQDLNTLNMRGYWALDPCIPAGDMCTTDEDCCDGASCENGVCGGEDTCSEIGEYCDSAADCCDPTAQCIAQECVHPGPQ